MVTNSWGSTGLKIMIQWKKSGIFLRLRTDTAFLSQELKSEALNYPLHQMLASSIQNKATMKTFHLLSCCDIKMTIMTSYFRIRDDVIKIF